MTIPNDTLEYRIRRLTNDVPAHDIESCDLLNDAATAMRDAADYLARVERKYPAPKGSN